LNKVFEALASAPRRKILADLAKGEMNAGEIAARFAMSKPAISKHLQILEAAGLVTSEKRGQFVWYEIAREELVGTLRLFLDHIAPESEPLETLLPPPTKGPRIGRGARR
jgi:ArsR family transcriptional regulator